MGSYWERHPIWSPGPHTHAYTREHIHVYHTHTKLLWILTLRQVGQELRRSSGKSLRKEIKRRFPAPESLFIRSHHFTWRPHHSTNRRATSRPTLPRPIWASKRQGFDLLPGTSSISQCASVERRCVHSLITLNPRAHTRDVGGVLIDLSLSHVGTG